MKKYPTVLSRSVTGTFVALIYIWGGLCGICLQAEEMLRSCISTVRLFSGTLQANHGKLRVQDD